MSREESPSARGMGGWFFPGGREPTPPKSNGGNRRPLSALSALSAQRPPNQSPSRMLTGMRSRYLAR